VIYVVVGLIATNVIAALVAVILKQQKDEALKVWKAALEDQLVEQSRLASKAQRLEAVITELKVELRKAEADLAACSTPDAVRARLDKLFH
jgi:hypothetical protein